MSIIVVYRVDFMNPSQGFINFIHKNYHMIGVGFVCVPNLTCG